jgi:sialic acid synthase SpsE
MPESFYKKCEFTLEQYLGLIEYGKQIGIGVFFSIFSEGFHELEKKQDWYKTAGNQKPVLPDCDRLKSLVSIKEKSPLPELKLATPLYVTDYFEQPNWRRFQSMQNFYGRPIGYSDHTLGIDNCIVAYKGYNACVIEKHFTLRADEFWRGDLFRDTVHGATPGELRLLAKEMREYEKRSMHNLQ